MPATVQLKIRRGTAAAWTAANPVLATGEMGYESDSRMFKIGDGVTAWVSLPYVKPMPDYNAMLPWTIEKSCLSWASGAVRTGTWVLAQQTNDLFGFVVTNTPAAQNDEIGWDFPLAAGTWNINITHLKASSGGIITVNLDGTPIGTIDTFNATTLHNQQGLITGFTVPTSGKHRVSLKMATRNASATQYELYLCGFQLRRTA